MRWGNTKDVVMRCPSRLCVLPSNLTRTAIAFCHLRQMHLVSTLDKRVLTELILRGFMTDGKIASPTVERFSVQKNTSWKHMATMSTNPSFRK